MNFPIYFYRASGFFSGDRFIRRRSRRFSPLDISGLKLWLSADTISGLADGATLATWPDQSGNGNDVTQGTGANQPVYRTGQINGLPIVRFDGSNDYLQSSGSFTHTDAFAVVKYPVAEGGVVTGNNFGDNAYSFFRTGGQLYIYDNSFALNGANSSTAFQLVAARFAGGGGSYVRVNGSNIASGSLSARAGTTYVGRRHNAGAPSYLNGDLAELLIYDVTLATADRDRVELYLNQKYAIY